jgi:hypothetical protein
LPLLSEERFGSIRCVRRKGRKSLVACRLDSCAETLMGEGGGEDGFVFGGGTVETSTGLDGVL